MDDDKVERLRLLLARAHEVEEKETFLQTATVILNRIKRQLGPERLRDKDAA
jgi:hypothetical protein